MKLVASSDSADVPEQEARTLLCERLALAKAVCHALDDDRERLVSAPSRAALDLLRRWVRERYPTDGPETLVGDGLKQMHVPASDKILHRRLLSATGVCAALAWLYTADSSLEFRNDSRELEAALERWKRLEAELLPPPSRPARSSLQILTIDYAHGYAEVDEVVEALIHGPDEDDQPPWSHGMNDWTGIDYLHSVGDITDDQITPLRQAYDEALLTLIDDQDQT